MKKIATIFLLSLMLFNMGGYRLFFTIVEKNATKKMEAAIDAGQYDEASLIEIIVPLNMPYLSDRGYEAAYGETQLNGQVFRYVKRKISNNHLYLLCLPHLEKNNVLAAKKIIEKNSTGDTPADQKKGHLASLIKLSQVEFMENKATTAVFFPVTKTSPLYISNSFLRSSFNPLTPGQPPEQPFAFKA